MQTTGRALPNASASHLVCHLDWDVAAGVAAAAAAAKAAGSKAPVQKVAPKKARLVCHRGFWCLADFFSAPPCRTQSSSQAPVSLLQAPAQQQLAAARVVALRPKSRL